MEEERQRMEERERQKFLEGECERAKSHKESGSMAKMSNGPATKITKMLGEKSSDEESISQSRVQNPKLTQKSYDSSEKGNYLFTLEILKETQSDGEKELSARGKGRGNNGGKDEKSSDMSGDELDKTAIIPLEEIDQMPIKEQIKFGKGRIKENNNTFGGFFINSKLYGVGSKKEGSELTWVGVFFNSELYGVVEKILPNGKVLRYIGIEDQKPIGPIDLSMGDQSDFVNTKEKEWRLLNNGNNFYCGKIFGGKLNGEGTAVIGKSIYKGKFKDGELNGNGYAVLSTGEFKKGTFVNGELYGGQAVKLNGEGILRTYVEGKLKQEKPFRITDWIFNVPSQPSLGDMKRKRSLSNHKKQ